MVPMPDIDSGGPRELVPKPSLEKETEMYKPTYPIVHTITMLVQEKGRFFATLPPDTGHWALPRVRNIIKDFFLLFERSGQP